MSDSEDNHDHRAEHSPQSAEIITSGNRPILRPTSKDGLIPSHPHDKPMFINLYPSQDLGPAVDDEDTSLLSLRKYMEGNNFDLPSISYFLSDPDPILKCAALQLLEHAAEWQSTNFTDHMSVTFGPVAKLVLDSRDIPRVHCAALDTLKLFLAFPDATVKSEIPSIVDALSDALNSPEPLVQLASVELLEAASRSEEIFVEFAAAVSRISSALPSMPTSTKVTALRVLEISAGSDAHKLVKAVTDSFQCLQEIISSPEITVHIAAQKVLEASMVIGDPELACAVKKILEVGAYNNQQTSRSVGQEGNMNVEFTEETSVPVDFKIKPIPYPSAFIKNLERNPHILSKDTSPENTSEDLEGFRALYISQGDAALSSKDYDKAIELYLAAIYLDSVSDTIFAGRCIAKLGKMLWEDALVDAQKVIELNPSSGIGYELKNAALYRAGRYDEAIEAFEIMLSKLNDTPDKHIQMLLQQYISSSEADLIIQKVINTEMENVPTRLVNTSTGRLCDREAQINAFRSTLEYKRLLFVTMKHANLRMEHIQKVVTIFFQYVMLSHRWEGKEPLLHDIQDRSVYELDPVGGITKLQSFCKVVRDAGYRWAWSDTCCINKNNVVELQQSVNSMFVWYRHSALTVVYLSDVLPSSKSGALAMSVWNSRGWTVQEFLASKIVLFYQKDWTLYLDDHSSNHKESTAIMRELEDVTGINGQALVAFEPGMSGAREKLQWSSMRVTTLQEDIAYSLFGIFGVHLLPIYGENRQNALGRLLQEIISQSGDITCLDWVGKSSEFNSCLPASITSYKAPPSAQSSPLSEDEMQTLVASLQNAVDAELASMLYQIFASLSSSTPKFMARRLRLPCIVFAVTAVRRRRGKDQQSTSTFGVRAEGLHDLLITTEDRLNDLLRERPSRQSLLLVRPWDRSLLEPPDSADLPSHSSDTDSKEDWSPPVSPLPDSPVWPHGQNRPADPGSYSRALRLIAHFGQPFSAFLLVEQRGGEYKRIASDQNIIAQVKNMTAVRDMMDVRTLEIL